MKYFLRLFMLENINTILFFQHAPYSSSLYNRLYGHPHRYPNLSAYRSYSTDTLSYSPRSTGSHIPSCANRMKYN